MLRNGEGVSVVGKGEITSAGEIRLDGKPIGASIAEAITGSPELKKAIKFGNVRITIEALSQPEADAVIAPEVASVAESPK